MLLFWEKRCLHHFGFYWPLGDGRFGCSLYKPCPFESGLRKFALDPVVVIFSKKVKKITSVSWSSHCKFFWNALDPTLVFCFWKWKNFHFQKNYKYGIKAPIKSNTCIFFWNEIFLFPKKLQVLDQVHFKNVYNDWIRPTLVIFLTFFEKNYKDWIKCKLPKSRTKWTGLQWISISTKIIGWVFLMIFLTWELSFPLVCSYFTLSYRFE